MLEDIAIDRVKLPVIPWKEIKYKEENCLGEGGFGTVYKGNWKHAGTVAIKIIKGTVDRNALEELQTETGIMAQLNSPYIISLFGLCWERQKYGIVMELMPKGSLYNLLRNDQELPWDVRYNISKDIAYGLRLLHDRNILHRDVKSLNVLLNDRLRAKLTDFGLAKVKSQSSASTKHQGSVGTLLWMAPELFEGEQCSKASDLYAYGMVNWEISSRALPFEQVHPQVIPTVVSKGKRPAIPNDCPKAFADLIKICWSQEAEQRPDMDQVVEHLEKIIDPAPPQEQASCVPIGMPIEAIESCVQYQDETMDSLGILTRNAPLPILHMQQPDTKPKELNESQPSVIEVEAEPEITDKSNAKIQPFKTYQPLEQSIALYSQGLNYYQKKQYKEAIDSFTKAALQGNDKSQCMLGIMYNNGQGVESNLSIARTWWCKSANQGCAESQSNLGFLFYYGKGIIKDHFQAKELYEQAALQNHAEAQNSLAFMYQHGKGVTQDLSKAKYWYEQAAAQGHSYAKDELLTLNI